MPTIGRFNVTPMKGTALHHPERVELWRGGIPGNRRFFLIDQRGRLFSGYDHGALVRLRAAHENGALSVTFPDGTEAVSETTALGDPVVVDMSGRAVAGRVMDGTLGRALSDHVGRAVRVVMADRDGDGSDVHHLSVLSEASVRELASAGGHPGDLDARRFRMDVELTGCEPFEEDGWDGRIVRIGEALIRLRGQIPRCRVTNQDPTTGRPDWATLNQIAAQRPRIPGDGGLPFGMYAEVERPGSVAVGDDVAPLG